MYMISTILLHIIGYYNRFTRNTDDYSVEMRIEGDSNQSLTVLMTNHAGKAAKGFGFTRYFT